MIKAIVSGAGGRMGGRIISLLSQEQDIKLAGAVEQKGHPTIGLDIGERLGLGKTGVFVDDNLRACIEKGDIVIDFTHHEVSMNHLEIAREKKRAIVIGSTGFTPEEMETVRKVAAGTRCVLSPNMSIGVNVMGGLMVTV